MNDKYKKPNTKAISLEKYGSSQFAWEKNDAQALINSIIGVRIGILGGDVYKLFSNRLEPTYDNWACEKSELETTEEYYTRSKIEALEYIKRYSVHLEEGVVFSLVFTKNSAFERQLLLEIEDKKLEKVIPEITDTAAVLENDWLMCPICVDAWQTNSQEAMVRCPKCEKILHNSRFKVK